MFACQTFLHIEYILSTWLSNASKFKIVVRQYLSVDNADVSSYLSTLELNIVIGCHPVDV